MNQADNPSVPGLSEELGQSMGEGCVRLGGCGSAQISRTLSLSRCIKFFDRELRKNKEKKIIKVSRSLQK